MPTFCGMQIFLQNYCYLLKHSKFDASSVKILCNIDFKDTKTNEKSTYHEDLKTTAITTTTKTKFSRKKNTLDDSKIVCM